ncbi:hypothetical protein [Bdellovibrio svalbardensis]|uniref:DUF2244 domain-containing protein n=1 Tax=Bdellovibrio svalbardensis TaxID=2972972 RepID=A0ABT6DHB9_9BACT|nr:hypothetical protein [Bdellovibrio svalbardensis]MDG0816250.1 hypothetical protein [Bdellovibrio svalbardensis]
MKYFFSTHKKRRFMLWICVLSIMFFGGLLGSFFWVAASATDKPQIIFLLIILVLALIELYRVVGDIQTVKLTDDSIELSIKKSQGIEERRCSYCDIQALEKRSQGLHLVIVFKDGYRFPLSSRLELDLASAGDREKEVFLKIPGSGEQKHARLLKMLIQQKINDPS